MLSFLMELKLEFNSKESPCATTSLDFNGQTVILRIVTVSLNSKLTSSNLFSGAREMFDLKDATELDLGRARLTGGLPNFSLAWRQCCKTFFSSFSMLRQNKLERLSKESLSCLTKIFTLSFLKAKAKARPFQSSGGNS